ncbi:2Fe-2S iron-sulfur cluster-binding protein [Streptomyces camelliae]|uniref:2Fe-2S iron-sulfur cluster-binding protein n=1 Tax=Streptomyces camelliae TaxID=3004093 RepID=A0ABY7P8W6_9ACTN|nr:2Fe-2S iron-sulfur cluster-binding protein [Streptomyces sp. HUAS 2-6]WBO65989.1 2Fe-2S iron-sulfur cluster-binding protein [Streptomyces sp. HUAS 2-6]
MTDDQHGEGTPRSGGRWDPLPQGDYDDGATAFVQLPEGGIDALLSGDSPLAAPGHGYVPPRITAHPGTDEPAAAGTWGAPAGGTEWPDPNAVPQPQSADDRFTYQPGATQQWTFEEPAAPAAPGHDVTGQWSIPVAGGDLPDESGEFTTSSLVEQWGGTPPATLPGGAPAPWATDGAGTAWGRTPADMDSAPLPDHTGAHPAGDAPAPDAYTVEERYGHAREERYGHAPGGYPEPGHAETVHEAAGHGEFGHTEFEHAEFEHDGAGHAEADRRGELADAHASADPNAPTQAPEDPADAPASHEGPAPQVAAPQAATAADTAGAAAPADPADTAVHPDPAATAHPAGTDAGAPHDTPEPTAEATGESAEASAEEPTGEAAEASADSAPGDPGHSPAPQPPMADPASDTGPDPAPAQAADGEDAEEGAVPLPPHDDHPLASYVLRVNGADRPVTDAWIGESLLYVLRERLGLAGAKDGCSQGECGACNVQVDGRLVASCLVPAVTAAGSEVRTVEGLAVDGQPSDVQRALARCGAVQCGFCVPGMAMTVHDLLEGNPAPTELETRQALCGNLCRCSGYRGVLRAVQEVVAERADSHTAGAETNADEARIPHQAGPGSGGVNPSAFDAPGVFDTPEPYSSSDPYGTPGPHDPYDPHGTHDQHYGQDGGQV